MKILKNKRGFSLVELMVVVAIMGVLSAIAIPSYLSYQENAKDGVVESMLHLVDRTVSIESSLGNTLATIQTDVATRVWAKIQSNDKGKFDAPVMTVDGNNWCLKITAKSGANLAASEGYAGYEGCVSNSLSGTPGKALVAGKIVAGASCSGETMKGDCEGITGCKFTQGTGGAAVGTGTCAAAAAACDADALCS